MIDMIAVKGTLDVLADAKGKTLCVRTHPRNLHPMIREGLVRVVRQWEFQPMEVDGHPVAYLGRLTFYMCHLHCQGKMGIFVGDFPVE
jgi:hypothetical protein